MTDPFDSSRQKISWAEKRFKELHGEVQTFGQKRPYKEITQPHPDKPDYTVQKIIMTEPFPSSIPNLASEVAGKLRDALDNAGYALAVAAGKVNPKFSAFPFAGSLAQMANSLGRSRDIPKQMHSLFVGFQPYQGGDDLLWALNEVAVADKHKTIIPLGQGMLRHGVDVRGTGFFEMPEPHVWDRTKNEMILITLGPGAKYNYHFQFSLFVAFDGIPVVDGERVVEVLYGFCDKVRTIIDAIEFESKRLGIVK